MQGPMIVLGLGILTITAASTVQRSDTRMDQVQSSERAGWPSGVTQVGERSTELPVTAPAPAMPSRPVMQLSSPTESQAASAQLTTEARTTEAAPQEYRGKTAREPDPLSRPSEGRTGAVTRVEGNDRCDREAATRRPDLCARVIETRAAEFTRPDPLRLSPEQRLLVDHQLREASSTRLTAKRADERQLDPETVDGQEVAAVALGRQGREESAETPSLTLPELPEASAALIEALLRNGVTQQPR